MLETKRPLKVFLCHAHADRDAVRGLYTRLTKDGVDAWLDKEKLLPGQDWEYEIRKAVREADVVVVCLSKQFNQAGFRQKEVRWALDTAMEQPEGEIFIIPARLEECDNLESLRKWHWVDLFEDDGYEKLIQALRARAEKIGATLQIRKGRIVRKNSRDDKGKIFVPESSAQLSNEIIIPLASSLEDCILYLRKYFTQYPHALYSSLGGVTWEERFNPTSQEWQTLLFRLKPETMIVEGKEVKGYGDIGEKTGVFSVSKLSPIRSKLQITRSDQGEEFVTFILELIQQLRDDNLIDGIIRGIDDKGYRASKKTKNKKSAMSGSVMDGDVLDSVIVTGSGNVINVGNQEKNITEEPQLEKSKSPRKLDIAIIVALISLVGTIAAALLSSPLIDRLFPTATPLIGTATMSIATGTSPAVTTSPSLMAISTPTVLTTHTSSSISISLLESFPAPGIGAEGLTWDGISLWVSDNSGTIFKLDATGKLLDSFASPEVTPQGMTWDGSSFWVFATDDFFIYQFQVADGKAQTLNSFRSPAEVAGGGLTQDMAWDGESLWFANQFKVFNLDKAGNVLSSFTFSKNVTGLDWDGSNLWLAFNDFPENASWSIVDTAGEILDTNPALVYEVNGLAWAGDYVWVLGRDSLGGDAMIYKIGVTRK